MRIPYCYLNTNSKGGASMTVDDIVDIRIHYHTHTVCVLDISAWVQQKAHSRDGVEWVEQSGAAVLQGGQRYRQVRVLYCKWLVIKPTELYSTWCAVDSTSIFHLWWTDWIHDYLHPPRANGLRYNYTSAQPANDKRSTIHVISTRTRPLFPRKLME